MKRKKKTYLPYGIQLIPRQIMGTPPLHELEAHMARKYYERHCRLHSGVLVNDEEVEILKLMPNLCGSFIRQNVISEESRNLLLDDPFFVALVVINDYENLTDDVNNGPLAGELHRLIVKSPISSEIMCHYVRQKYPERRHLIDRYYPGLSKSPMRMARILKAAHSESDSQIRKLYQQVSENPYVSPDYALFYLAFTEDALNQKNPDLVNKLMELIAQDPALLFEAALILRRQGVNDSVWMRHFHRLRDPRWIYHVLINNLCSMDTVKRDLEETLMFSSAWAVDYLDSQTMDESHSDQLFRLCHENAKGRTMKSGIAQWYRMLIPEKGLRVS